jgi:hypothetical protein
VCNASFIKGLPYILTSSIRPLSGWAFGLNRNFGSVFSVLKISVFNKQELIGLLGFRFGFQRARADRCLRCASRLPRSLFPARRWLAVACAARKSWPLVPLAACGRPALALPARARSSRPPGAGTPFPARAACACLLLMCRLPARPVRI